jgi:hypothetical protein
MSWIVLSSMRGIRACSSGVPHLVAEAGLPSVALLPGGIERKLGSIRSIARISPDED